jgi:hypothetical protein
MVAFLLLIFSAISIQFAKSSSQWEAKAGACINCWPIQSKKILLTINLYKPVSFPLTGRNTFLLSVQFSLKTMRGPSSGLGLSLHILKKTNPSLKGSLTRDFRLQVFFMNQCPPGPQVFHWSHFEFFRKFAEIFANYCLSPVSLKLISGVNDTGEKFIAGVIDTGD